MDRKRLQVKQICQRVFLVSSDVVYSLGLITLDLVKQMLLTGLLASGELRILGDNAS